jgi:hypothetical protein
VRCDCCKTPTRRRLPSKPLRRNRDFV